MADERFLRGFGAFDQAIAPRAAFADRLFADLADELGLARAGSAVAAPSPVTRIRRVFGFDLGLVPRRALRLAYLAAVLALLLALLAGTAFVASRLLERHVLPGELVTLSKAATNNPPAFRLVYRSVRGVEMVLASNGAGTWRMESADTPGSYTLYDGRRIGQYSAQPQTWDVGSVEESGGLPPVPLITELAWSTIMKPGAVGKLSPIECAGAAAREPGEVAGRPADVVYCPDWMTEFWLDQATHLVLKFVTSTDTPGWPGDAPAEWARGLTALSLQLGPPDPAEFSFDGPAGAYSADNPPPSTVLVNGQEPPRWTGTTIDGASFDTAALPHPTAILFRWALCTATCGMFDTFTAAAAAHPGVSAVVVLSAQVGTAVGFRSLHPTDVPVVADPDGAFVRDTWGINADTAVVLLDRAGHVAGVFADRRIPREDLDRQLDALVAGEPMPTLAPTPAPTPVVEPSPTVAAGSTGAPDDAPGTPSPANGLLKVEIGRRLPAWEGALLGGGTFDLATLVGRPAVITWFQMGACDFCKISPFDPTLDVFAPAAAALAGRATFVLIGLNEPMPGDNQRAMDLLGITAPVVMDWDGSFTNPLNFEGTTIVLDAKGRVAATLAYPHTETVAAVLDRIAGAESPAPGQPRASPTR